jgi:phage terminase small subunit
MPRRSIASLSVIQPTAEPAQLAPPGDLSDAAKRVWLGIVSTTEPDHFRPSDIPLMKSYCVSSAIADEAAAALAMDGTIIKGKASPWTKVFEVMTRAQNTLSVRLRLCPSSRMDPKTVGRSKALGPGLPPLKPWEKG